MKSTKVKALSLKRNCRFFRQPCNLKPQISRCHFIGPLKLELHYHYVINDQGGEVISLRSTALPVKWFWSRPQKVKICHFETFGPCPCIHFKVLGSQNKRSLTGKNKKVYFNSRKNKEEYSRLFLGESKLFEAPTVYPVTHKKDNRHAESETLSLFYTTPRPAGMTLASAAALGL